LHLLRSHASMSVLHSGKAGKQPSASRCKRLLLILQQRLILNIVAQGGQ